MANPYDILTPLSDLRTAGLQQQLMQQKIDENNRATQQQEQLAGLLQQAAIQIPQQRETQDPSAAPPGDSLSTQRQGLAQGLLKQAQILMPSAPKEATALINESLRTQELDLNERRLQLEQHKKDLDQTAGWLRNVTDDTSYQDTLKQVQQAHPDSPIVKQLRENFPIYSPQVASLIKNMNSAVQTPLQQIETELKQIQLKTFEADNKAKLEKDQLAVVQAKQNIALKREKIQEKATNQNIMDKYQGDLQKLDLEHEKRMSAIEINVGKESKKYPNKIPEVSMLERYIKGTVQPTMSPRDEEIQRRKASELQAYQNSQEAIRNRYRAKGLPIPESTKQKEEAKSQFVEGKIYQDASGNKARYENGQWVPEE